MRKSNFGFVGGADINIGNIILAPRIGLDALKNTAEDDTFTASHKNIWIQTTIGYWF